MPLPGRDRFDACNLAHDFESTEPWFLKLPERANKPNG
jgi:hypothetical protein